MILTVEYSTSIIHIVTIKTVKSNDSVQPVQRQRLQRQYQQRQRQQRQRQRKRQLKQHQQ